jgi:hypothetical protein
MNFIKHIFTGADGVTYDVGRVSWAVSLGAVCAAGLHSAWKGAIDLIAFGTAISAVVIAHGAALGFKKETEPK